MQKLLLILTPALTAGEIRDTNGRNANEGKEDSAMTTHTHAYIARSDVVGSLLRPAYLREVRQGVREGRVSAAELRAVEDRAVHEAIALRQMAAMRTKERRTAL